MSLNTFVIINEVVKKGVNYIIGLYAYLYSDPNHAEHNVINTLKPALGEKANDVYREINEKFKGTKEKAQLRNEARNILKNRSEII
jgi:hypothetical protein